MIRVLQKPAGPLEFGDRAFNIKYLHVVKLALDGVCVCACARALALGKDRMRSTQLSQLSAKKSPQGPPCVQK